jgi:O-antigen chain-terminating methyltransferase
MSAGGGAAEDALPPDVRSALEERFRGPREEIARRLSVYVPLLEAAGVRDAGAPVLDIGCGRGEWLELLGCRGVAVCGVDIDEAAVGRCRLAGWNALVADATDHLRAQPEAAYAAVTCFHMVEHLPAAALPGLLEEIHRALRPGGVAIIETPNPENFAVASCGFRLDPAHLAPLPPELLRLLAEQAGFSSVDVVRVNAEALGSPLAYAPAGAPSSLEVNAAIHVLNLGWFAPPDYAVIAQKAGGTVDVSGSEDLARLRAAERPDIGSFRELGAETAARDLAARVREAEESMWRAEAKARETEALALETELRRLAAEARAYDHEARASDAECRRLEAEVRASEAELKRRDAEARAQAAEVRAAEIESRLAAAEAKAHEWEAKARIAEEQFAVVCASESWRVTAPLRWLRRAIRRGGGPGPAEPAAAGACTPADPADLTAPAREVFADLERAFADRDR